MEKLNVAIADDNERMLRLLGAIIESDEELNVVGTAKDGEEAYNVIKTKEPDVVLLDIVMPKLDGLGVLDRVNHDKTIKKHPTFIMISAIGQEKITEDAFELGADYYIMKPFDNDMVINRIKKAKTAKTGKSTEPRKANAYEKAEGEQSPVALILCAEKSQETIELMELDHGSIHVGQYLTKMPPKELLEKKLSLAIANAREQLEQRV